jgi:transposase
MTSDKKTRRRYSESKKAQVLAECCEPGASVAKVAMAHGINANVVHRWRQLCQGQAPTKRVHRAPASYADGVRRGGA